MNDWQVLNTRATFFTTAGEHKIDPLWSRLVAEEPDSTEARPREGAHKLILNKGGRQFLLQSTPGRVDWIWSPALSTEPTPIVPVLGQAPAVLEAFLAPLAGALDSLLFDIVRMAFGATFLMPTSSREESYGILATKLKNVRIEPGTRELQYQINRPVKSNIYGEPLELNRLTKWWSTQFHLLQMIPTAGGANPYTSIPSAGNFFVQLEVDNSTPADGPRPLKKEALPRLMTEMVALAKQNLEQGEV